MKNIYIGRYHIPDGTKPIDLKVSAPVEWILLEEKGDESLVYSKDCLDWEFYGEEDATWINSYMKVQLTDMYNSFFSQEEKDAIIEKESDGPLFLLSPEMLFKYFPKRDTRRAVMHFVFRQDDGEIENSIEHHSYWLKADDSCNPDELPIINSLGELDTMYGDADEIGVRPAMWINTKKARELTAKAGFNKWHHRWKPEDF